MKYKDFLTQFSIKDITQDSKRVFSTNKLQIDQSTLSMNENVYDQFESYAENNNFIGKFNDLIEGIRLNNTENRQVTHFNYRNKSSDLFESSLDKMDELSETIKVRFKKIIIFGIGGSYLGPKLMEDIFY